MKLLIIRAITRMLSWITPQAAEKLAPPVATLLWYLSPRKRRVTRLNLRTVYPEMDPAARRKIARDSMTHYIRGVFEAGMLWHWDLDRIFDCFEETPSLSLYDDAQGKGKGVILAGTHGGSWELLALYMQKVLQGSILYKPGRQPDVEELLLEKRRRAGATLIPATPAGLRTMFKALKAHETVALVPDQEPTLGQGQFAPFFGVETLTGVILPRMARRTGAPVLFSTCERCPGGRYQVHLFKADDSIYDADMRTALTAVNRGIEQCIEVDTAQYLWAYKRFRNRPGGEKSIYKR